MNGGINVSLSHKGVYFCDSTGGAVKGSGKPERKSSGQVDPLAASAPWVEVGLLSFGIQLLNNTY